MTDAIKPRVLTERKPLTARHLRELVHYDPETGIMTSRVRRHRIAPGDRIGTPNNKGHLICRINYTIYYVHRLIFLYMTVHWPAEYTGHKRGDPSDNRWAKLREATPGENSRNRGRNKKSAKPHKNIGWNKADRVWRVSVKLNGKEHYFGRFRTIEAALVVRDRALRDLHGEFARFD